MSTPGKAAYAERVRATQDGFYNGNRVRAGRTFTITDPKHFSKRWMVKVPADTPDDQAAAVGTQRRKAPAPVEGRKFATQPADEGSVI